MKGETMARVAPKGRKHRSADALLRLVRSAVDQRPDHRSDDVDIALSDAFIGGVRHVGAHVPFAACL